MTDERLSRRARRAQEEDALSGELPTTTGGVTSSGPDTQSLSRRDRRRLERVSHPVEVWTAEEEMIATGQIPKVTPEVIAEQERAAREKAAQAQAEAEAASAELRRVATTETSPSRVAEVMGVDAGAAASAAPAAAAPPTMQNLFPPGSLQARAFEESQARAAEAQAQYGQAQAASPAELAPAAGDDAAEEIRRLAAAAMATIESAAPVPTPAGLPQVDATSPAEEPFDRYAMPQLAQPEPEPSRPATDPTRLPEAQPAAGLQQGSPFGFAPVGVGTGSTPTLTPGTGATPALTPGTGATPTLGDPAWQGHPLDTAAPVPVDVNAYAPVTEVPRPDFTALQGTAAAATGGTFSPFGPGAATGSTPLVPGAPATGSTPLVPGAATTGSTPLFPGGPPPTTGSIPTVRRGPELQPAGGARHFRRAHYAVLFALMFIVGVVVYQVFRLNS